MENELPPPEVWHGLSDYEYSQVYENSSANPHRRLSKKQQKRLQKELKQQAENGLQNGITIPDTLKEQFDMNKTKEQTNADAAVNEIDQLINDESNVQPTSTTNINIGPENVARDNEFKRDIALKISDKCYNAIDGALAFYESKSEKLTKSCFIERVVRFFIQNPHNQIPNKFNVYSNDQLRSRLSKIGMEIHTKSQNYATPYDELIEMAKSLGVEK